MILRDHRFIIASLLVATLPQIATASNSYQQCKALLQSMGRRVEILVAGETHETTQSRAIRGGLLGFAASGKIILGLEGSLYGSTSRGYSPSDGRVIQFEGIGGTIQGIEGSTSYITTSSVHTSATELGKLNRQIAQASLAGRLDQALPSIQQLKHEQNKFISEIFQDEFARAAWNRMSHDLTGSVPGAQRLVTEIDRSLAIGSKPVAITGAFMDSIAYEQVFRKFSEALIEEAEQRIRAEGRTTDISAARDFLRDPSEQNFFRFHRDIANGWRNEDHALNTAALAIDAAQQNKAVAVVVGAAHVDPIVKRLEDNLQDYAIVKGINAINPF